jgi:hypothetical protein
MNRHVASLVILASTLGPGSARAQSTPISLVFACEGSQRMTATIRNVGTDDTAVIFGIALANGAKYLVVDMTLQITSSDGKVHGGQYHYYPSHYPSGIAGRVDDWIVPLPAGASYTLAFEPADFLVGPGKGRLKALPQGRLSLRLPIRSPTATPNSDVVGLKLYRVWTGNTALTSNELATSQNCR